MIHTEPFEVRSEQFEVLKSIEGFVGERIDSLLRPVSEVWQPSDFLPDTASKDFADQHKELQR